MLDLHTVRLVLIPEMQPQWYSIDGIPYKEMWPDDLHWFPLMLNDKRFIGYFKFEGMDKIVEYNLSEVENIPE